MAGELLANIRGNAPVREAGHEGMPQTVKAFPAEAMAGAFLFISEHRIDAGDIHQGHEFRAQAGSPTDLAASQVWANEW